MNNIYKPLVSLAKRKREKTQITSEMEEGTSLPSPWILKDNKGIPWITLCPQFDNLKERDQFSERHTVLKFTQRETDPSIHAYTYKRNGIYN